MTDPLIIEAALNGVTSPARNVHAPITLVNDILQGEDRRAGQTFTRIVMNTTRNQSGNM